MTGQTDLFATPLSVAPPITMYRGPSIIELLPARTLAWDKLLARSIAADQVTIFVSHVWTGEVVEVLCDPVLGAFHLHADGLIQEVPSAHAFPGRTIFLAELLAQRLHVRAPLIESGRRGTHAMRYRFAKPGETAPAELELPEAYGG